MLRRIRFGTRRGVVGSTPRRCCQGWLRVTDPGLETKILNNTIRLQLSRRFQSTQNATESGLTRALLAPHAPAPAPRRRALDHFHPYLTKRPRSTSGQLTLKVNFEEDADDVIDLGAPRIRAAAPGSLPPRAHYTPNPRLYPGPERKAAAGSKRGRRRKRVFRRPVPNSRLYRPAPPRPPPPPAVPRAAWPAPPPPARLLDTASRAALRLVSERRRAPPAPPSPPPPPPPRERRLVVTLPAAGDAQPAPRGPAPPARYRPASEHFRARTLSLHTDSGASSPLAAPPPPARPMDAPRRHSASPDDRSEGNDSMSAPSEFLAEFLSAIMRRQYAEALKYCRLILQYEPHNATARGFYPLLQHKLAHGSAAARRSDDPDSGASSASSGEEGSPRRASPHEEVMEQDADSSGSERAGGVGCAGGAAGGAGGAARRSASSGSVASQSSLELDSSDAPARSSPDASLDLSRTDRTDSASASASGSGWDSSGSAPSSARDDNGNFAPLPHATCACDAENNAPGSAPPSPRPPPSPRAPPAPRPLVLGSDESAASLRRLRAQFACSIK